MECESTLIRTLIELMKSSSSLISGASGFPHLHKTGHVLILVEVGFVVLCSKTGGGVMLCDALLC